MGSIEGAFVAIMLADSSLIALVGDRIFPMMLPEGTQLPALTYHGVDSPMPHSTLQVETPRIQVSCWASTYGGALGVKAVAQAVKNALHQKSGMYDGVRVIEIRYKNMVDDFETDTNFFHIPVDFVAQYRTT
jgi:hypothetical protein